MIANRLGPSDEPWLSGAEAGCVAAASPPFSVLVDHPDPDVVVVSVVGEIDLLTASPLRDQLNRLLAPSPPRLVIDLTHASFLGAAALSVLIDARRVAAQRRTRLQLTAPKRSLPARTLKIAGLDRLFDIVPPIPDAARSLERHLRSRAEVPRPRTVPRTDQAASASVESVVETDQDDDYEHLIPLQRRYAELASDDPQRHRLRDQLIQGYLPVAEHIARRFTGRGEPLDDLVQVAILGLINAIDRFDPARGSHFLAFAVPTITGEIRRYFRDHGWSTHVPRRLKDLNLAIRQAIADLSQRLGRSPRPSQIAQHLGIPTPKVLEALRAAEAYQSSSLDDLLSWGEASATTQEFLGDLDPQMCLIDDRETLRPLLARLTPRQRTILILRFCHELSQHQIAEQVGLSQMHVSRLLRQMLDLLHRQMADSRSGSHHAGLATRPSDRSSTQN
jgi:RNA polymerase sigma-B factor